MLHGHHKEMIERNVSTFKNSLSGVAPFLVLVHRWFVRAAEATRDTLINHCNVGESRLSAAVSPHIHVCN